MFQDSRETFRSALTRGRGERWCWWGGGGREREGKKKTERVC